MLIFYVFLVISFVGQAQVSYKTFHSEKLAEERNIKIQLPRGYDSEIDKKYPLILVLDGDYLFEPMAGSADYFSYWDEIPECIVVGINQMGNRVEETAYDDHLFLPFDRSARFFEFVGGELLPYLESTYRTSNFVLIAGHDMSANFINYYLFKDEPLFRAYLNLSPDLAPEMASRLTQKLEQVEQSTWFYLATASDDIPALRTPAVQLNEQLRRVRNPKLSYLFDDFEDANHYTLVGRAFPSALEQIFKAYAPIGQKEYQEIVAAKASAFDFLVKKYQYIKDNFGISIGFRKDDLMMIGKALEYRKDWDDLERLGKLARDEYPDHTLGTYFIGRSFEEKGKTRKAIKMYRSSFGQSPVDFITFESMLDKAEALERELGYD